MEKKNSQLPDELNPQFLFSSIHSDLLIKAVNNQTDLLQLAKRELANRGLDNHGKWVGFEQAAKIFGVK